MEYKLAELYVRECAMWGWGETVEPLTCDWNGMDDLLPLFPLVFYGLHQNRVRQTLAGK